jgi:hypothetical protein
MGGDLFTVYLRLLEKSPLVSLEADIVWVTVATHAQKPSARRFLLSPSLDSIMALILGLIFLLCW